MCLLYCANWITTIIWVSTGEWFCRFCVLCWFSCSHIAIHLYIRIWEWLFSVTLFRYIDLHIVASSRCRTAQPGNQYYFTTGTLTKRFTSSFTSICRREGVIQFRSIFNQNIHILTYSFHRMPAISSTRRRTTHREHPEFVYSCCYRSGAFVWVRHGCDCRCWLYTFNKLCVCTCAMYVEYLRTFQRSSNNKDTEMRRSHMLLCCH